MKPINNRLLRSTLCSLVLFLLGVTPALPCAEGAVLATWVLPNQVLILDDDGKRVAGIIACISTSNAGSSIDFDLDLVDLDRSIAETPADRDNEDDDILGRATIMGVAPGANQATRVVSGAVYELECEENSSAVGIEGFTGAQTSPSFEGKLRSDNPADLALQVNNRERTFVTIPDGGPVPARCVGEETAHELLGAFLTGVPPPELFLPTLPDTVDLGYNTRFEVKEGEAHLTPITQSGGAVPKSVSVNVGTQPSLSASSSVTKGVGTEFAIEVTGSGSFVDIAGTVAADGTIDAAGSGTVAGFQNIDVTLTGTLQAGVLDAEYSMGTDGDLPGGFPIVFDVEGTAPEFDTFWTEVAQALEEAIQPIAAINLPTLVGGVEFEDLFVRQATNLMIAQAGLRFFPDATIAETALSGVGVRINDFADEVSGSTLVSRTAAETELRAMATALGDAGEQLTVLRQSPPGPTMNAGLTEWLGSLSLALDSFHAFRHVAFGTEVFTTVPAASYDIGPVATDSIVSGFALIGAETETASTLPLPTELGDFSILLTDSEGIEHLLELFLSSNTQFNFLIPPGAALGQGLLTVFSGDSVVATGLVNINSVTPSIFTANASGEGVPAALLLRVETDGSTTFLNAFNDAPLGQRAPLAIDLTDEGVQYFLVLFGSGFRNASEVKVRIDGQEIPGVIFAPSSQFKGLDQGNVPVSRDFMGRGVVNVELEADGIVANVVVVAFL